MAKEHTNAIVVSVWNLHSSQNRYVDSQWSILINFLAHNGVPDIEGPQNLQSQDQGKRLTLFEKSTGRPSTLSS